MNKRKPYKYKTRIGKYIHYLNMRVKKNERAFRIYTVLRVLVILTLIRTLLQGNYESAALCILSLVLFLIPSFMEEKLHIEVPAIFQIIIYLFIYAAEILGEVNRFYTRIPGWDTMLHTLNGFLCAAIGFSLVDLMNKASSRIKLSPFYLSVVAFCFSMTIGVCWEFIEYFFDSFFFLDMQKDFVVQKIGSIYFDETNSQIPITISGITKTVIYTASGKTYTVNGGYLDIGLNDTMKDLLVNLVGAITFSVIGYIYTKTNNARAGKIAEGLRVTREDDDPGNTDGGAAVVMNAGRVKEEEKSFSEIKAFPEVKSSGDMEMAPGALGAEGISTAKDSAVTGNISKKEDAGRTAKEKSRGDSEASLEAADADSKAEENAAGSTEKVQVSQSIKTETKKTKDTARAKIEEAEKQIRKTGGKRNEGARKKTAERSAEKSRHERTKHAGSVPTGAVRNS